MNALSGRMPMTRLVVIFNWHFFLIAGLAASAGIVAAFLVESQALGLLLTIGAGAALYFVCISVLASYFVYDHSDLYQLNWWPERVQLPECGDVVLVHAGFDPASRKIIDKFPDLGLTVLDFFEADTTTETLACPQ